jgi:drug/metabolite transporter (DMT)-like permease
MGAGAFRRAAKVAERRNGPQPAGGACRTTATAGSLAPMTHRDRTFAQVGSPLTPPAQASAALLVMVVIWAVNFAVAKNALAHIDPLAFNALRFPLAALVVLVALRLRGHVPLPARRDLWKVLALGVLGNVLYQQFFIFGLANTRAGIASVLLAGTPIVTTLLSAAFGHERIGPLVWTGAGASFVGITLVVTSGSAVGAAGEDTLLGDALMIGATLAWAAYTVGARPLIQRYGSVAVTAWTLWSGTIGVCLIGLPAVLAADLRQLNWEIWAAIAYAGALSIGLAYLIWTMGVRTLGNTRTAAFSNLVPALALVVAWLWLGEVPSAGQLVGTAVILGGVTVVQLAAQRPAPPAAEVG